MLGCRLQAKSWEGETGREARLITLLAVLQWLSMEREVHATGSHPKLGRLFDLGRLSAQQDPPTSGG